MRLYVIRHGEVDVNVRNQMNGRNDSHLTPKGILQTQKASLEIKDKKIDLIICSKLKRTMQTCELLNTKHLPVIYDDRILERDTRSLMYKSFDRIDDNLFYDPQYKVIYDDCEGFGGILERVTAFIESIMQKYPDKNILVITHGDVCRAIYCYINKLQRIEEIKKFGQDNCEVMEYEV